MSLNILLQKGPVEIFSFLGTYGVFLKKTPYSITTLFLNVIWRLASFLYGNYHNDTLSTGFEYASPLDDFVGLNVTGFAEDNLSYCSILYFIYR